MNEKYRELVSEWHREAEAELEAARRAGDERAISVCQMKKSLTEGNSMLSAVPLMTVEKRARVLSEIEAKIESRRAAQDFDEMERAEIQRTLLQRAIKALEVVK